jgi:hypothetical protein
MREIRQSGSEGGVALTTPSLPLSTAAEGGGRKTGRESRVEGRGPNLAAIFCWPERGRMFNLAIGSM